MTEGEWLAWDDPWPMLKFLRGKASDRKLRLFAVACCRRIWHRIEDERSRKAVEAAERFADGLASGKELETAQRGHKDTFAHFHEDEASYPVYYAVEEVAQDSINFNAFYVMKDILDITENGERIPQVRLLRDIFGNPFRPSPIIHPGWLAWNGGTVKKLGETVYEERAFDRLPVLADALEEAGCTYPEILAHSRQPGEHVRGCWAVDQILGK